jgi:hypothetical protein
VPFSREPGLRATSSCAQVAAPTTLRLRFGSKPGEPVGHSSCGVRATMK